MPSPRRIFGHVGNSLTTGNEGALGAVILYLQLAAQLRASFARSAPQTQGGPASGIITPGLTTFDGGAPSWSVYGADGTTIAQIRANMNSFISRAATDMFFEGGTNDLTDSIAPATSNAALVGAMNDAATGWPYLQNFYYVGVCCIGEMYQVLGGVPSFAGNSPVPDATTDSLMALLKASVLAQTGTNAFGATDPIPLRRYARGRRGVHRSERQPTALAERRLPDTRRTAPALPTQPAYMNAVLPLLT